MGHCQKLGWAKFQTLLPPPEQQYQLSALQGFSSHDSSRAFALNRRKWMIILTRDSCGRDSTAEFGITVDPVICRGPVRFIGATPEQCVAPFVLGPTEADRSVLDLLAYKWLLDFVSEQCAGVADYKLRRTLVGKAQYFPKVDVPAYDEREARWQSTVPPGERSLQRCIEPDVFIFKTPYRSVSD